MGKYINELNTLVKPISDSDLILVERDGKSHQASLKEIVSPTANSKILWVGTSIPAGNSTVGSYPELVGEALGCKVYNNAVGGSKLTWPNASPTWSTYSELESGYTKFYSLSATKQDYDEKVKPVLENLNSAGQLNGTNVNAWMRLFYNNSFENTIIPYIDGTVDTCDVVVIDHGFNDKNEIFKLARTHKDDTVDNLDKWPEGSYNEGQYYPFNGANAGYNWLCNIGDTRHHAGWAVYTATWDEINYVKEGKGWYKTDYFKAYEYLIQQIWKVNPRIKIIVGNFYSKHFGNPWGEGDAGYITKYIITANTQFAKLMGLQCVEVHDYLGLSNKKILKSDGTTTTDMLLFAPDGIHPSSDTTGESNKRIAEVYVNALREIIN